MRNSHPLIAALFDPYRPQFREVMRGMVDYTTEHEPDWELVFTHLAPPSNEGEVVSTLRRFDGFIDSHPTPGILRHIAKRPSVLLEETQGVTDVPVVCSDMAAVGRVCAEHLAGLGLQQFAVVTSPDPERGPDARRRLGFTDHMTEFGLPEPAVFRRGSSTAGPGVWSWEEQVDDLAEWIADQPRPLGVMSVDIAYGWRTFAATRHAGLRVPEDVCLVVGGDDELIHGALRPAVSGVAYDQRRVGYLTARTLHHKLTGQPTPAITRVPPLGVIERQSTLFTASDDPVVEKAMRFIWQHVDRGLTVQDVADRLPVSHRTLTRRFERSIGRTPHQEIRRAQLHTARRLLTTTDFPLDEVAVRAGLGTASNLSQAVRRATGLSPTLLRRQHR